MQVKTTCLRTGKVIVTLYFTDSKPWVPLTRKVQDLPLTYNLEG